MSGEEEIDSIKVEEELYKDIDSMKEYFKRSYFINQ
jgi:hypothetical protein